MIALLLQIFYLKMADPLYKTTMRKNFVIKLKGIVTPTSSHEGRDLAPLQRRLVRVKSSGPKEFSMASEYKNFLKMLESARLDCMLWIDTRTDNPWYTPFVAWQYRDDHLCISIQHSSAGSFLPEDSKVLIVMARAGSGPALLLCFVGERARLRAMGLTLTPALRFVDCRHPDRDMLFPVITSHVGSFGWDADLLRK